MTPEKAARTTPAYSPDELVAGVRAGDETAWRAMSEQYEPLLRWLARRYGLSAEDAGDAVQLTWLRCLEHIDQLTAADKLTGWLATICRRECIRLTTKARREVPLSAPDVIQLIDTLREECDPCSEVTRRDERYRLSCAITALPARQRLLLRELLAQEYQSYLELSRRLSLPMGSIGPTRRRALARLRQDPQLAGCPG